MQKKLNVFENVRNVPLFRLITGGLIIVIGILFSDIPKMILSPGWPTTEGTILYHRFVGQQFKEYDGDLYTHIDVHIRYQYAVNGKTYSSLKLNSIDTPFHLFPSSYAGRYPVGTEVIVFYNPKNPSDAVLEPGFADVYKAFDVFFVLMMGVGIYFIYLGISKKLAQKLTP